MGARMRVRGNMGLEKRLFGVWLIVVEEAEEENFCLNSTSYEMM